MQLSVIIPTFNEESTIQKTLDALARLVNIDEIVIADGGSTDRTLEISRGFESKKKLTVIEMPGAVRGRLLHEGALRAEGDIFWFLRPDTRPIQGSGKQIKSFMRFDEVAGGNFEVIFGGETSWEKLLTKIYPPLRSAGLIYGDSGIFVRRAIYEKIGGFKFLPIFEDLDLAKRIQKKGRFVHINLPITTSAKRFANQPFFKTFFKWSFFQSLYWLGFPPKTLAKFYLGSGEKNVKLLAEKTDDK